MCWSGTGAGYAADKGRSGSCELCGLIVAAVFLPFPWQEFVEPVLGRFGDAVEDIGEPGLRIDVVELCGADERVHRCRPYAAAVRADERHCQRKQR